jgi:hypothetical protein
MKRNPNLKFWQAKINKKFFLTKANTWRKKTCSTTKQPNLWIRDGEITPVVKVVERVEVL